jgi:hypothetical protein
MNLEEGIAVPWTTRRPTTDEVLHTTFTGRIQAIASGKFTQPHVSCFFRFTIAAGERIHVFEEGRYSNSVISESDLRFQALCHANGKIQKR